MSNINQFQKALIFLNQHNQNSVNAHNQIYAKFKVTGSQTGKQAKQIVNHKLKHQQS